MSMPENERPAPHASNLGALLGGGDANQTSPGAFPADLERLDTQFPAESVGVQDRGSRPNTVGHKLASHFVDKNIHPICIYGSKGSGKTTFIASMFQYLKFEDDSTVIELCEDVFLNGDDSLKGMEGAALRVFNRIADAYGEGSPPSATLDEAPFFIPVRVTPRAGEPVLFAFLEGRGEWYMPTDDLDRPNREFHGLLQGFLQHFTGPVTTIYMAPYTGGETGQAESPKSNFMRLSDKGLYGAALEYRRIRGVRDGDDHIALVTKWDVHLNGNITSPSFVTPTESELNDVFRQRFPNFWTELHKANIGTAKARVMSSCYSASVVVGGVVVGASDKDKNLINYHKRKLWNMLYVMRTGKFLYEEFRPKKLGILARFRAWLKG